MGKEASNQKHLEHVAPDQIGIAGRVCDGPSQPDSLARSLHDGCGCWLVRMRLGLEEAREFNSGHFGDLINGILRNPGVRSAKVPS